MSSVSLTEQALPSNGDEVAYGAVQRPRGAPWRLRQVRQQDLHRTNAVIADAIQAWQLPARVVRLATPSLGYTAADLLFMQVLTACQADGRLVGVLGIEFEDAAPRAKPSASRCLHVHGLYVSGARQGQGLGGHLLEHAARAAREAGVATLRVRAWREAAPFFQRRGFRRAPEPTSAHPHDLWRTLR